MNTREIIFASGNPNKVEEIGQKLGGQWKIIGLKDVGITDELPETSDTLEGNARQKAWAVWERTNRNCFADDTGLEVRALHGEPGVQSAFYAGPQKSPKDNVDRLLREMDGHLDRRARFRTVICCILDGTEYLFEGTCDGHIARERRGDAGFGYDPVFVPEGSSRTFAQMSLTDKNILSHRGKAVRELQCFLAGRIG